MRPEQFLTHSLQDIRIARILHAAIQAADPAQLVAQWLARLTLPSHHRVFLLGLGKAAEAMTLSAADALGDFESALIITKHQTSQLPKRMRLLEAGHPIPDERSLVAGQAALRFVSQLQDDDLLVCLLSGGGSALAAAPVEGVALQDLQGLTSAALACGASIEDINVLRRQLDLVKGGGLAASNRGITLSLILSDVLGDRLEAIASGPTAPNPTGAREALAVVQKFHLPLLPSIQQGLTFKTARLAGPYAGRVTNVIVGNSAVALNSALVQARTEGIPPEVIDAQLQGEAREVGERLAARLASACTGRTHPFCMLAAGETTVTLTGRGQGGRNQELALASVDILSGIPDCMFISLATDGNDGPTDAAGAVVTGATKGRAASIGLEASAYLNRHDSYHFFEPLGDLLRPGYTGTNVNDLQLLLGI